MAYGAKRDGELEAVLRGLQTRHAGQQRPPGERHRLTRSLSTYALVNALLVAIWSITTGYETGWSFVTFWPIWSIVGWGFAVAMQALHYLRLETACLRRANP